MGGSVTQECSCRAVRANGTSTRQIYTQFVACIHFAPLPDTDTTCTDVNEIMCLNLRVPKGKLIILCHIEFVLISVIALPEHKDSRSNRRLYLTAIHEIHRTANSDKCIRGVIHRNLCIVEVNHAAAGHLCLIICSIVPAWSAPFSAVIVAFFSVI